MTPHIRCQGAGLGRAVLRGASQSCLVILAVGGSGCSHPPRDGGTAQFAQFQNSIANSDSMSLVAMFSAATRRELAGHGESGGVADEYARFLVTALRPACPLQVEDHSENGDTATFSFRGQNRARGRVTLIYDHGHWSLDLVGPVGQWLGLRKWAHSISDSVAAHSGEAVSVGGIEMIRPTPDEAVYMMFGVPGVTDDDELPSGEANAADPQRGQNRHGPSEQPPEGRKR
jgi:hypothetical protein